MSPLASSRNGILCDFVPPIVIIKISAARHDCIHATNVRIIRILKQECACHKNKIKNSNIKLKLNCFIEKYRAVVCL